MLGDSLLFEQKEIKRCPYCNESYYTEKYTMSTAMYCPTVIKDGKVISNDCNIHTTVCECKNCGKEFKIVNGKVEK